MFDFNLKSKEGVIISYGLNSGRGVVKVGRYRYKFELTSWKCGRVVRYPKARDNVRVVFSANERRLRLVSVWAL